MIGSFPHRGSLAEMAALTIVFAPQPFPGRKRHFLPGGRGFPSQTPSSVFSWSLAAKRARPAGQHDSHGNRASSGPGAARQKRGAGAVDGHRQAPLWAAGIQIVAGRMAESLGAHLSPGFFDTTKRLSPGAAVLCWQSFFRRGLRGGKS